MTYEEKLLAVFARYAGQGITSQTLVEMEDVCEKEVWAHLPTRVKDSWKLHLAFNEARPGQIDLSPRQVGSLDASELEHALKQTFVDRSHPLPGGIAQFSLGFSSQPDRTERFNAVVAQEPAVQIEAPAAARPVAAASEAQTSTKPAISAQSIEKDAAELGIKLPPNSSLLQPFLEALQLAVEYKRRAEAAEAALKRALSA